jgi:hypothetical protein
MHLALSPVTLLPLLSAALLIVAGTALVLRSRGSNSGGGGGRHSGGGQPGPRFAAAPDPRFAPDLRFARDQGAVFAAQPHPRAVFAAPPDPRAVPTAQPGPPFDSQPDPRLVVPETSWSLPPAASISMLASLSEGDKARPNFAPSNSGEAFPTASRALSLVGGHILAAFGLLILTLASTPIGHHVSHVGNTSVGVIAILCVFVGFGFAVPATARVQRDIMGGGWYAGFSPRYISYISPQIALYVISPSGISAAARRLNLSPARVILIEYGLLTADVLIMLARYVAR